MSATPAALRLEDLDGLEPLRRLVGRNRTKADILVYRLHGTEIAVKDYGARPWLVRQTIGRLLIRRESAAYLAAGPVEGLPPFHGRLGPFALATGWLDARPLADVEPQSGLARAGVGAVTLQTAVRQQRADLRRKVRWLSPIG